MNAGRREAVVPRTAFCMFGAGVGITTASEGPPIPMNASRREAVIPGTPIAVICSNHNMEWVRKDRCGNGGYDKDSPARVRTHASGATTGLALPSRSLTVSGPSRSRCPRAVRSSTDSPDRTESPVQGSAKIPKNRTEPDFGNPNRKEKLAVFKVEKISDLTTARREGIHRYCFSVNMTNWKNPAVITAEYYALVKLYHVIGGVLIWEFVVNIGFEYSVFTGRRNFRLSFLVRRVTARTGMPDDQLKLVHTASDFPARLGLKAQQMAWLLMAWAQKAPVGPQATASYVVGLAGSQAMAYHDKVDAPQAHVRV
ncbi:hypothetical protein EDB83DRAFT_2323938 [Lactarius deliciosus]|nr:hypothetical protein EDB83DRAFT_2323938 [Lactarius deliciosus]